MPVPDKRILNQRAKTLRQVATKSERRFRQRLFDAGIPHQFQYVIGFYIADFFFFDSLLIIELDGEIHADRVAYDKRRDDWLRGYGFTIIRIKNKDADKFDLSAITSRKKAVNRTNALNRANTDRNRQVSKENIKRIREPKETDILWRKDPHKSGHTIQKMPTINYKRIKREASDAFAKRKVKVIKKNKP